jgi:hypothetical protein
MKIIKGKKPLISLKRRLEKEKRKMKVNWK